MPGRSPSLAGPLKGPAVLGGGSGAQSQPPVEPPSSVWNGFPHGCFAVLMSGRGFLMPHADAFFVGPLVLAPACAPPPPLLVAPCPAHCPHSFLLLPPGQGPGLHGNADAVPGRHPPPAPDGCASLLGGWGGPNLIPWTPASPPSCLGQLRRRDQGSSRCSEPRALPDSGC